MGFKEENIAKRKRTLLFWEYNNNYFNTLDFK